MSMLSRYKKSGGFVQLLKLIETSGKVKQEKFLTIIESEEPVWAATLKEKMITMEKVLSWPNEALAEVFSRLTDITLAICYHVLTEEQWRKVSETFSHSKLRKLNDIIDERAPTDAEKSTAIINILSEVRNMISDGYIRLDAVDPKLIIEDDIEEKLSSGSRGSMSARVESLDLDEQIGKTVHVDNTNLSDVKKEMLQLKKKIVILGNENNNLRKENREMRERLDKIKKIAV